MSYRRGSVVKGPDLFADNEFRPYVRLNDETHPFHDEEGLYAAVTSTERPIAIRLRAADFETGGLPRRSYVNPWTIAPLRTADVRGVEGQLTVATTDTVGCKSLKILASTGWRESPHSYSRQYDRIATRAAGYLGVE